jgi:hypothetical protein
MTLLFKSNISANTLADQTGGDFVSCSTILTDQWHQKMILSL